MTTKKPDVTKLPIYKSLLPRIRKKDRAEFRRMLEIAAEKTTDPTFGECVELSGAFVWIFTPQGHDYWYELYDRLRARGHGDVA